jgi:integrase
MFKAKAEETSTPALTVSDLIDTAITSTNSHRSAYDLHRKFEHIRTGVDTVEGIGQLTASEVTKSDLLEWLDSMTEERDWSNASRNRYQAALSLIFRIAVDDKKLPYNPASGIEHLQEDNSRCRSLTLEEEEALFKQLTERFPTYTPIAVLAMHTGPRASELLRIRVGGYSGESGKLMIRQTKIRRSAAVRHVPITPMAVAAYTFLAAGKKIGDPLRTQPDRKTAVKVTKYWFDPCVDAAKINDFRFHDLRHTAASRWVMNGLPLAVVSNYLGHSNIQMTMRYSHLSPENDERAIAAMMSIYQKMGE